MQETREKESASPKQAQRMVSPAQFAEHYGISRMTAYRMLRDEQVPGAIRVRGLWRIPESALEA